MKKTLLFFFTILFCISIAYGQSTKIELPILRLGDPITDTLDNGLVITFETSSDDAEQENDEMDALYDDDLDAGWEGDPDDQNILICGMRFRNVAIPKGATIDSAYLILHAHEGKSTEDVANITIVGEDADNAATYDFQSLISARTETTAKVNWVVNTEWEIWQVYRTPDLKTIIQEIIVRQGWQTGNPVNIILKGENQGPSTVENAREWESFENISDPEDGGDGQNHPERVPRLVIYYSFETAVLVRPILKLGESVTDTLDNGQVVFFDTSSDDAEQENDEMDSLYDDDLDAGWEGDPDDQNILTCGMRFRDITIPQGAHIDSAFIVLHAHEGKSSEDIARITIVGEASDNAQTYDVETLITSRPETEASLLWEVAEEWEIWQPYRTPNLRDLIQEIIDRQGWTSGNALSIVLKGENQGPSTVDNAREWESFENISDPEDGGDGQNHPERVPVLFIYYQGPTFIGENQLPQRLHVYPNPVMDGIINIALESDKPADIYLYDLTGKMLMSQKSNHSTLFQMNIEPMPKGIYFIKAIQEQNVYTQKLVVNQ
jgi:hypothetical protein